MNSRLPAGIIMPKKYYTSIGKQRWFIQGARDALEGITGRDMDLLQDDQGRGAREAYQSGYEAGKKLKEKQA
ncbi:MAG: hypothetical protein EXR62_16430 [Chloroflexi bacterium]|nr:hypothetical protein [Chloroflexota bacterium]